jgi:glycosyltransferase involved in cell wall biosynthesis
LKKIAYIEIDTQAEIAQSFMDIMQDSQEFSVDFYLSEKIRNQVNDGENIFLSDSSMILDQLKNKAYDLVIIGTLHRYFNTFQVITQKYNTAVIVHNLNFTRTSGLRLVKNIFKADIIYRLKLWWKEGLFNASKIYQETKNVLVLDEALSSERFKFLPIFYTQNFERSENQNFVVVIPGGVSQKRRDYDHIFNIIQNLKTDEKYEFIFLGKAKDHELKKLEKIAIQLPSNVDVTYFSERVSQKDFDFWMRKANVLWCPIQPETEFFSQKEIYGNSKMTGNLGDAIKYGKLAVFPENYPCQLDFIIPEQQDILKQFQELKNTDFDFQLKYSKNTVRENLETVLNSLISI